jgi:hypothetical protein
MKEKSSLDLAPDFAKDAKELLERLLKAQDEQEKLFEIVKKLSEYYIKGKKYDVYSQEKH